MDANLNFATTPSSNPTSVGASSGSKGLDPSLAKPMNGQEFAGVMRDLMAKGERQELAGTEPKEATDATTAALQTLNLGSQFSVITAASPLPDPNSLAQFARAQGLSESAVQALFGDLTMGMSQPASPVAVCASVSASTLTLLPSAPTLGWIQATPSSLTISAQVESSVLAPATQLTTQGAIKTSDVSALLATAGATGILKTVGDMGAAPIQALSTAETVAEMSPELGPLDAMRMRMVPAWENMTRQLAKLNGTDQAAAWGQMTSNILSSKVLGADVPEVLLDLGVNDPALLSTFDTLQDPSSGSTISLDSARNTASTGTLGAAATSAALANPGLTDRAAQIQDLADKLGKAMGERLQEQLERGEWKLQLKLNPAHLGKIDVELDMSTKGLDAIFKTDNQLTRELIAQGMNKLKDSLAQSGMTVANVWVNSENQRGSGGNSTPRQNSESDNHVSAPVSDVKAAESRIKELRSSDAWDALA
ncbi:MAG: flagellar hook-length control protein FliK [Burkholderiales bacterium]|nr:flagellar hook-length control protein FliK [Burkholderiales bacterium]